MYKAPPLISWPAHTKHVTKQIYCSLNQDDSLDNQLYNYSCPNPWSHDLQMFVLMWHDLSYTPFLKWPIAQSSWFLNSTCVQFIVLKQGASPGYLLSSTCQNSYVTWYWFKFLESYEMLVTWPIVLGTYCVCTPVGTSVGTPKGKKMAYFWGKKIWNFFEKIGFGISMIL